MKQNCCLCTSLLAVLLLFGSCSAKTIRLRQYIVKQEFAIGAPEGFKESNQYPDQFSFSCVDAGDSVNINVQRVSRAAFEEQRLQDSTVEKYPFTLTGFSACIVDNARNSKVFREISSRKTSIGHMPAVIHEIEFKVRQAPIHMHIASVQESDNLFYRIMIVSKKGAVPYADDVFHSFRIIEK